MLFSDGPTGYFADRDAAVAAVARFVGPLPMAKSQSEQVGVQSKRTKRTGTGREVLVRHHIGNNNNNSNNNNGTASSLSSEDRALVGELQALYAPWNAALFSFLRLHREVLPANSGVGAVDDVEAAWAAPAL